MQKVICETGPYREAEMLYQRLLRPGSGQVSDAAELSVSSDGSSVVCTGTLVEKLEGAPATRVCRLDLASGEIRVLTFGPNADRLPKYSPGGEQLAFLSDRLKVGDFQLYLLDLTSCAARAAPRVEGWVEYLHWSPDGRRILLGVAGHGADLAGGHGAISSRRREEGQPSWTPSVETGEESFRWRSAWVYELATNQVRQVSTEGCNVWEAVWCGNERLAAVLSTGPGEGHWYGARLHLLEVASGESREVYAPTDQLGWPAGSPSGRHLAVVEALCSDRWIVAGELRIIDTGTGKVGRIDTRGVDITYTEWRSDRLLLLAGCRGFESVIGRYDAMAGIFTEVWASRERAGSGRYPSVSGFGETGDCALIAEDFTRAPEIATIRRGEYRMARSLDLGYAKEAKAIGAVESLTWQASDGLEIQGWLLRPRGSGPHPLVMNVHGGPVWQWRPSWLGRPRTLPILMLLQRGYAVFFPNPRGSTGRGQAFVRPVLGDMGGADTRDCLFGLDELVKRGIADPERLGVMGVSYGGFMTAWLISQDSRFAAAVPVAPVTNQVTEHLISNIPHFVAMFLQDHFTNPRGRYFERSPIMHAHRVRTPTLIICGALDRCTPPEEAVQFHHALLENGSESVLVTYPEEGHGVRKFPAAIDFAARVVAWFQRHMQPQ